MLAERTWVGLDVHARSVVGCAIDDEACEIRSQRVAPQTDAIVAWVLELPGPVAVTYEAGPTGFGLARALAAAGVRCEVVAPSKLERPPGDKVKTDRRDAERLARLLRIGELPAVRVPSEAEEAARDLVRAREDARGDLMRARHRLSKLLLRQGIVWDRSAWTGEHIDWLRRQHFDRRGVQLAFDEALDAVFSVHARRDRLDTAIDEMAETEPLAGPVGRLRCLRGVSTLTAVGLCVEVADWHRSPARPSAPTSGWCPRSSPPGHGGSRAGSPRPATPTPAGCWSKPPGTTVARCVPASNGPGAPTVSPPRCGRAPRPATAACTNAGAVSSSAASARRCRWSPWPASSPAGAGASQCSTRTGSTSISITRPPDTRPRYKPRRVPGADAGSARSDPRVSYEQLRPTLIERGDARP